MKKIILLTLVAIFATVSLAQTQKDVTQFLGIPVDGYKSDMINKLKAKGYTVSPFDKDVLTGEFNGNNVNITIQTNNNKVWRIAVFRENSINERNIKIQFNNLYDQFVSNKNYNFMSGGIITEDEDIGYSMLVKKKQYAASFIQNGDTNKVVWFTIIDFMSEYNIAIFYENRYNAANGEDL